MSNARWKEASALYLSFEDYPFPSREVMKWWRTGPRLLIDDSCGAMADLTACQFFDAIKLLRMPSPRYSRTKHECR